MCFRQVISAASFRSPQAKGDLQTSQKVNYKSECVIYLMECILCKKQYDRKVETPFNNTLNKQRKDIKDLYAILACKFFHKGGHNFSVRLEHSIHHRKLMTS